MFANMKIDFLSESEMSMVHDQCFRILMEKGVKVEYKPALELFENAGARVDYATEHVYFTRDIIEAALRTVPKEFTARGAAEAHDMELPHPSGSFYTSTCIQSMQYHDPDTGRTVDNTVNRFAEWCQLAEVLPNVHKVAIQTPMDVPHETADVHALKVQLENTSKPLMILAYCPESVDYLFELLLARAGSVEALKARPLVLTYPTSLSPLKFKPMDLMTIQRSCQYGIPVVGNSLAISGATAPITPAGTALLAAVEILAMVVMTQIYQPGHPFVGSVYTTTMDMKTGNALLGNTESMLSRAVGAQFIKKAFNIPTETFSFMSDAYLSDGQAVLEKSLMPAMLSLAESDIQYGMGRLGGPTLASPVQMVMDDRIFTIIQRSLSGVEINEETLAMQEIFENAPDGQFLTNPHTLRYCRDGIRPDLFVADSVDTWKDKGGKDLYERAVEKYNALKKDFKPQALSDDVIKEMEKIVKRADEQLVGKLK